MTPYVLVLITTPTRELARAIGRQLVEQKIAACASLLGPVESIYAWQGSIEQAEETLMLVKTRAELVETLLIPAVKALHPYEVPEIIAIPIQAGLPDYLNWINAETADL